MTELLPPIRLAVAKAAEEPEMMALLMAVHTHIPQLQIQVVDLSATPPPRAYADIVMVLNSSHTAPPGAELVIKRLLRNLPPKQGLVIANGRDGLMRKVSRPFGHKTRWIDPEKPWPGLVIEKVEIAYVARLLHELGWEQEAIKAQLKTSI